MFSGFLQAAGLQLKKIQFIVIFLVSSFLLSSVFFPDVSEFFAILLLLFGFYALFVGSTPPIPASGRALFIIFSFYSIVSICSFLYWPLTSMSHMRVEDDIKFILFLPVYLMFLRVGFDHRLILALFLVVSMFIGLVSLGQYFNISPFVNVFPVSTRPSAGVNPMRFAAIALILACFLVNYLLVYSSSSKLTKVLIIVAFILAVIGCALAKTRGVWLAIPFIFFLYVLYAYKKNKMGFVKVFILGGIIGVGLAANTSFVQDRMSTTYESYARYQNGNGYTSLGARLDMFKASLILAQQKPLFGHGLGVFQVKSKELKELGLLEGRVHPDLGLRKTPHNEIFQALVERGVVGVLATFLLVLFPAYIFYGAIKSSSSFVVYCGLCGLSLLLVFCVAGQTGTLFNHNLLTNFYIILILLFMSQVGIFNDSVSESKDILGAD